MTTQCNFKRSSEQRREEELSWPCPHPTRTKPWTGASSIMFLSKKEWGSLKDSLLPFCPSLCWLCSQKCPQPSTGTVDSALRLDRALTSNKRKTFPQRKSDSSKSTESHISWRLCFDFVCALYGIKGKNFEHGLPRDRQIHKHPCVHAHAHTSTHIQNQMPWRRT